MIFHPPLAAEDLSKSALVLRVHFPGLPAGKITEQDVQEATIVDATDLVHSAFGYTVGALKNAKLSLLVPQDKISAHTQHLARFWHDPLAAKTRPMGQGIVQHGEGGGHHKLEINGRHADGSIFPITIGLRPFIHGGEAYVDANIGIVGTP